jgi:hypothetical protein
MTTVTPVSLAKIGQGSDGLANLLVAARVDTEENHDRVDDDQTNVVFPDDIPYDGDIPRKRRSLTAHIVQLVDVRQVPAHRLHTSGDFLRGVLGRNEENALSATVDLGLVRPRSALGNAGGPVGADE